MGRSDKAEALAQEIGGFAFRGDVARAADLEAFVALAMERTGRIDAIVPNSGHAAKKAGARSHRTRTGTAPSTMMMLPTVRLVRAARDALAESKGAVCAVSSFANRPVGSGFLPPPSPSGRALDGYIRLAVKPLGGRWHTHQRCRAGLSSIPASRRKRAWRASPWVAMPPRGGNRPRRWPGWYRPRPPNVTGQTLIVDGGVTA